MKPKSIATLILLVIFVSMSGVAATNAVLPSPAQPTAASTENAGELQVAWSPIAGAQFYTVGWINQDDYNRIGPSGDWPAAFHYASIPASSTSYTVSGLKTGESYWTIVGARVERYGGTAPSWSLWSDLVTTAGEHGGGFCPITGLPLPPTGYLSVGQSSTPLLGTFTLNSVTIKDTFLLGTSRYRAPMGRKLIQVCGTMQAGSDYEGFFSSPRDYNVDTDAGTAFTMLDDDVNGWFITDAPEPGQSKTSCETWVISSTAQTVIVAVNNWQTDAELYKADLP